MLIDLHLHSPMSSLNGDSIQWNSLTDSIRKVHSKKMRMIAFTDHNSFDLELFLSARDFAATGLINVLPGVEANVQRVNGQMAHLLILFPENLKIQQLKIIQDTVRTKLKKRGLSISQANNLFNDFETIKIAHVGKGDFFSYDDLTHLSVDAIEVSNFSHPNYQRVMKQHFSSSIVAFSDTHIWKDYPQHRALVTDIDLGSNTFAELKIALKKHKVYAKEAY